MKVVRDAPPREPWTLEIKCLGNIQGPDAGCGTTLLLEPSDLYLLTVTRGDGDRFTHIEFRCCSCGMHTVVESHRVPHRISRTLQTQRREYGNASTES